MEEIDGRHSLHRVYSNSNFDEIGTPLISNFESKSSVHEKIMNYFKGRCKTSTIADILSYFTELFINESTNQSTIVLYG